MRPVNIGRVGRYRCRLEDLLRDLAEGSKQDDHGDDTAKDDQGIELDPASFEILEAFAAA